MTRSRARHGSRTLYVAGCRCDLCTGANREYQRARDRLARRVSYGIEPRPAPRFVDASEARLHLRWLATQGIGLRRASQVARVPRSSLVEIRAGRRRQVTVRTSDRILAVGRSKTAPGALVDAKRTWMLIDDLVALGVPKVRIAEALGNKRALQVARTRVTARTARAVEQLWEDFARRLDPSHGTLASYRRGCRCLRCRGVENARQTKIRSRRAVAAESPDDGALVRAG